VWSFFYIFIVLNRNIINSSLFFLIYIFYRFRCMNLNVNIIDTK